MSAIVANDIEMSFGDRLILRGCSLSINLGDRVGLVGANGSGKSTLVRIISGVMEPDQGEVHLRGSLRLLDQGASLPGLTVGDAADEAVEWHRELLNDYQAALDAEENELAGELQDRLDIVGWEFEHKINGMLERLGAPPRDCLIETLSGGERRRVALARVLLGAPDILILDEPTNHLDADTVEWLEGYLSGYRGCILLVTHDRYLLEAVSTRIIEIDDGLCVPYDDCSYTDYLLARAERRGVMERAEDNRLSMIRREAAWAARSPAARSTKQKARLDRLDTLKEARPLSKESTFTLNLKTDLRMGSTILELRDLSKSYGDLELFSGLTMSLGSGERIGIVGANGTGKSTLLKLIANIEKPTKGEIVRGPRLQVGMLDQNRTGLIETETLFDSVANGNDRVLVGETWVHVANFLGRFLFSRQMFDQKVAGLSGGERARLLLAKLLLQGANVLLLDEPTNDLDLLTLRVLEEALLDFNGCAIIVTHDRAFLDRVCTGVLAFHDDATVVRYADRMQHVAALAAAKKAAAKAPAAPKKVREKTAKLGRSFREDKEFKALPKKIETLEADAAAVEGTLADPDTYKEGGPDVQALNRQLAGLTADVEAAYERWEELEALG